MDRSVAQSLAIKEAGHIINDMENLLKMNRFDDPVLYNSMETELQSHLSNSSGLIAVLQTINDKEAKEKIMELEQAIVLFSNNRELENVNFSFNEMGKVITQRMPSTSVIISSLAVFALVILWLYIAP